MSEEKNTAAVDAAVESKPLKLDYVQTFKVGLAFAIIMVFWTAYDFVVPLLLENAYGLSNTLRGLIMGLDNLLSLFMLPLFGKLSDRGHGKLVKKFGRRTPYIIIGTILAAALIVFVPLSARSQQIKAADLREEYAEMLNDDSFMSEKLAYFYDEALDGDTKYCDIDYVTKTNGVSREEYVNIRYDGRLVAKSGFLGMGGTSYTYDGKEVNLDDVVEGKKVEDILKNNNNYKKYVASGMNTWISEQVNTKVTGTKEGTTSIVLYMVILLLVLIAMATFRSPAVALMPDVTPKPLRSQANAVINLCGGVGGAIAFLIYTVVLFGTSVNNYIIIFGAVAATMLILLAAFLTLVKEKKLVVKCRQTCEEYGILDEDEEKAALEVEEEISADEAVPTYDTAAVEKAEVKEEKIKWKDKSLEEKAKFRSFLLILASIFMWFMGYNAVSSSLSIYTTKFLNLSTGIASIISGVSMGISAIAFIPVGFLAVKIGRRKSIMLGFGLAVVSFVLVFAFVRANDNALVPSVLFALFYLIAGFGLIIANVNTFPMVVELADAKDVGKYTGYYYTATMSAQAITPMLAGLVMDSDGGMKYLFLYSACFIVLAIVLMVFVKHGDSKALPKGKLSKEERKQIMLDSMDSAD